MVGITLPCFFYVLAVARGAAHPIDAAIMLDIFLSLRLWA
jgi:hypothetical protein